MDGHNSMTLDEPVWHTVKRDLMQVGSKLQVVLLPRENQDGVLKKLKDWDLWGPLLVCLTLSILLSITAPEEQGALVFAAVFFVVWFGAAVVTLNAQLLGGTISFFQSLCILGYCVFPLDIAALANLLVGLAFESVIVKALIVALGFAWATRASVIFIGQVIAPERKVLALFPVFFFYTFLAWLVLVQ
ncbi:yipf6-like protein [Nannochloropsis oceanica]